MKVFDGITEFVTHYEPSKEFLYDYYAKHSAHYEEYFKYHCYDPANKMETAISKHQQKLEELLPMKDWLLSIVPETKAAYEKLFDVELTKDVHLPVGLYGSNAFTYRQYDPEIAFCLEKLPTNEESLRLIAAHEFGHAVHHVYSGKNGMEWDKVNWMHPYTWLFQEGLATHLSMKVVDAQKDRYFAFDFEEDAAWLRFAEEHRTELSRRFLDNLESKESAWMFKEWFSINGGKVNGEARLGYFLGYEVVSGLIAELGEEQVLLLWNRDEFYEMIEEKMEALAEGVEA